MITHTRSGNTISVYIKGGTAYPTATLLDSQTLSATIPCRNLNGIVVGHESTGSNYNIDGGIRRYIVYSKALTLSEINAL